ncbi:putative transporter [Aeromonas dhakensis]|uniref:putative transporter n=1 Tax=Aeromonas dhakensis TaxID=196024 RepID=UPI0038CFED59
MSDIALSISMLSLVAVLGLWLGNWRVYGVGLGIGGVLFGGIIVGHFAGLSGLALDEQTLHFIQEFGLILFVYTIGIQVGPGFFSSLRSSGLKLNGFAALLVLLGCAVAAALHQLFDVPLPVILGVFSGAVTNTPSLGAGQQILAELGAAPGSTGLMGMGYAVAYPFGICGILLTMWLIRMFFRIKIDEEAAQFEQQAGKTKESLQTINIAVRNPNIHGLMLSEIPSLDEADVICSRLKRGEELMVPRPESRIELGDLLHLVGERHALRKVLLVLGEEVETSLSTRGTDLRVERVVVTNEQVLGKKIRDLDIKQKYDVVISRLNRAGIELVPTSQTSLQFGDILNLVGRLDAIEAVTNVVGNVQQKLQQVQMLPVFIGIGLGVLLGSIPFYLPGFPAALKLGLAGGPLGAGFIDTLINGDGPAWVMYGVAITLIPLLVVGVLARLYGKMNYLTLCGLLAGSMTDPPALAFANGMHPTSGASALSYATVYPLVMFLRIISPQLLAILLWAGS